jgi:hypothetical protein
MDLLSETEIIDILESRISEYGNAEDAIASLDVDQFDCALGYYKPDDDFVLEIFRIAWKQNNSILAAHIKSMYEIDESTWSIRRNFKL